MESIVDFSESKPSKSEILRGVVTEKMTLAVRTILSEVEKAINAQECEVSLLKAEMSLRKNQMDAILQPQNSLYKVDTTAEFIDFHDSGRSEVECLRGIITETVSETVRDILAVVDVTFATHKHEVMSLKLELDRHKTQMNAMLQPEVKLCKIDERRELKHEDEEREIRDYTAPATWFEHQNSSGTNGVDDAPSERSIEDTLLLEFDECDWTSADLYFDDSVSSPAHGEERPDDKTNEGGKKDGKSKRIILLPKRYRSNHDLTDTDDWDNERKPDEEERLIELQIGLLPNVAVTELSDKDFRFDGPFRTVTCPRHLSASAFSARLTSAFPQPFEVFLTERSDGSLRLTTQSELYRAFKSCRKERFAFYVQIKVDNDECGSPTVASSHHNKSSSRLAVPATYTPERLTHENKYIISQTATGGHPSQMPSKRKAYSAEYKLQVVKFAAENGNRAAERKFGVNEKLVRDWRKAEATLAAMKKTKKANRGHKARWPLLEERVYQWVLEQRAAGRRVSGVQVRLHAQVVAKAMNIENFGGGPSWCFRFMQRNRLLNRARTTASRKPPADFQVKIESLWSDIAYY